MKLRRSRVNRFATLLLVHAMNWNGKVNRRIHPACEMLGYIRRNETEERAREIYFESAEGLIENVLRFLESQGSDPSDKTILDFACGYGRFARYFVQSFKSVTVSDVDPEMLGFCGREFGTTGFLSSVTDASVLERHGQTYDVVFCFSLFTHLNPEVWAQWFERLFGLVANGGYLLISTHSYTLFEKLGVVSAEEAARQGEFVFYSGNETQGRLDPSIYGSLAINRPFVDRIIAGLKDIRLVKHYEMGEFDPYHDVYIFQRTANVP